MNQDRLVRRGLIALVAVSGLLGFAALAADVAATVKERQVLMKEMGAKTSVVNAFIKEGKGTAADVEAAAKTVAADAGKIPSLFPEGTGLDKVKDPLTGAKPEIWTDRAKFEAAAKTLADEAAKLADIAKSGNKDEIAAQFGKVGAACGTCHTSFRQKI